MQRQEEKYGCCARVHLFFREHNVFDNPAVQWATAIFAGALYWRDGGSLLGSIGIGAYWGLSCGILAEIVKPRQPIARPARQ